MKGIPRSGWLSHGISLHDVESVADHTFSTCALSMLLADLEAKRGVEVNMESVLRMAILHDLAESLTFDISRAYLEYLGTRGEEMKREIERTAWEHLMKGVDDPELARKYESIQNQYVAGRTKEAMIVHAADSIDILLQVVNYERSGYPHALLSDFWDERVRTIKQSRVQSARTILEWIVREERRPLGTRKIK
jgi:putative hydrolases of HD superfamily